MEEIILLRIKKIIKNYISVNDYNYLEFSKKMRVSTATLQTYLYGKKPISNSFLIRFSDLNDLNFNDKKFLKENVKVKKKLTTNKENVKNKIKYYSTPKIEKEKKISSKLKSDFILKYIENNQDDYLKFMSALKEMRKNIADLDFLSIFNTKIKPKSKNEIIKLLQKTINEINSIQKKMLEEESIEGEIIDV